MIQKYAYKVGSVLASAALLGSTAALAAAASYPAPFVQNGAADVAVVWGANASPTDLVAVTDITAHLQAQLASQASTSGTNPSSVSGGDFVKLAKSSDQVNLGDKVSTVFGTSVDDDDLPALLADYVYRNDENTEFDVEQKITLGVNLDMNFFADSDHDDRTPSFGINLSSDAHVLNYTHDWLTDAESDVTGGDLVDIETTDLTILGKTFYVLDADNSTLKLTLLDSATQVNLEEGESKSANVAGNPYDVSIDFVGSATQTRITVNGETTNTLNVGETYKLNDGTYVGVRDILYDSKDTGISKVDISLGSGKVEIENGKAIELNDDSINGMTGQVFRGSVTGGKETLDKVQIEWKTDEELFIAPNTDAVMPGFGAVKLSMGDFVTPGEEVVKFDNDGTDSIEMTVPIKDGSVTVALLSANGSGEFNRVGGDTADNILRVTNNTNLIFNVSNTDKDRHFFASYNTSRDSESYLLRATSFVEEDGSNKTTIQKKVGSSWADVCKDKKAADTCSVGNVDLTFSRVYRAGSERYVELNASTGVSFNQVFTDGGLQILLPQSVVGGSADGQIDLSANATEAGNSPDSYDIHFFEEDKDGNLGGGSSFTLRLDDQSDGDVEVASIGTISTQKEVEDDNNLVGHLASDLSTRARRIGDSSSQRSGEVTYYEDETYAEIFLTDVSASVGGGSGVTELGSVSVSDADAATVASKNLIVVGGSCVNSVAADLVGSAICGADWEASTGVGAGQYLIQTFARQASGKVATLVAGYNAGDTTNAAKYLTTNTVDTAVGKKYVGTTASSASLA